MKTNVNAKLQRKVFGTFYPNIFFKIGSLKYLKLLSSKFTHSYHHIFIFNNLTIVLLSHIFIPIINENYTIIKTPGSNFNIKY